MRNDSRLHVFRNFYVNPDDYRINPPARILGASFLQWMFRNTPGMLERAPLPKRLTVVKRTGWRRIVNGDEFVQKARALGWQAEVSAGRMLVSCCGIKHQLRPATVLGARVASMDGYICS